MANTRMNHLEELSNSDYKIADDQPNIDNWKIVDSTGKRIGKVKDFLFDKKALKVRYLITNLKDGELVDDDRKVLIPIGKAQLNKKDDRVIVPNVNREQLAALPRYKKVDDMTQDDEYAIRNSFGGAATVGTHSDQDRENFYNHDDFDENRFYDADRHNKGDQKVDVVEENLEVGKRKEETGGARVTSRVVERPVEERVNLKEENVEVHRNKVDRPANSADLENFKEDTVEMHETKEVPVVNKEARVTEEVTLDKEVKNREEVVKDKVKHTEVDVENLDKNKNRDLSNDRNRDRNKDKNIDIHNTETDKMRKDSDRNRNA